MLSEVIGVTQEESGGSRGRGFKSGISRPPPSPKYAEKDGPQHRWRYSSMKEPTSNLNEYGGCYPYEKVDEPVSDWVAGRERLGHACALVAEVDLRVR